MTVVFGEAARFDSFEEYISDNCYSCTRMSAKTLLAAAAVVVWLMCDSATIFTIANHCNSIVANGIVPQLQVPQDCLQGIILWQYPKDNLTVTWIQDRRFQVCNVTLTHRTSILQLVGTKEIPVNTTGHVKVCLLEPGTTVVALWKPMSTDDTFFVGTLKFSISYVPAV